MGNRVKSCKLQSEEKWELREMAMEEYIGREEGKKTTETVGRVFSFSFSIGSGLGHRFRLSWCFGLGWVIWGRAGTLLLDHDLSKSFKNYYENFELRI